MTTIAVLAILALSITISCNKAEAESIEVWNSSNRHDLYISDYVRVMESHPKSNYGDKPGFQLSEVTMRLWILTGKDTYRDRSIALFQAAIESLPPEYRWGFHQLRSFAKTGLLFHQHGMLSDEIKNKIRPHAMTNLWRFMSDGFDFVDHNIRLAETGACACLFEIFKEDSEINADDIKKRLDNYWDLIKKAGDLNENAGNYTPLGQMFMIELAAVLGREDDLKASSDFRRMFERTRDYVSPTGYIAEWGDDYFDYTNSGKQDWIFVLEYAAKLYDDPSFLDPIRRIYPKSGFSPTKLDGWYRGTSIINMELYESKPQPCNTISAVTYRKTRDNPNLQMDKLILRTGCNPGDAMIMMDIYAKGSHAHLEKGPSLAYYEVDHVPLFHNLGRHHTRSAINGNIPWALSPKYEFPGIWKEGEWFTMEIPAARLQTHKDGGNWMSKSLFLRNFPGHNRNITALYFDNLRLEGQAGEILIDDFDNIEGWSRNLLDTPQAKVTASTDCTQGKYSQRINWGAFKSSASRDFSGRHSFAFREAEYDTLKLDVKFEETRPYMHIRGVGQQVDLGNHILAPEAKSALIDEQNGDAYGEVSYENYITEDSKLRRRIILAKEGILLIQDELLPGPLMDGFNSGQLWQLYSLEASGTNWFCAESDGSYPAKDGTYQEQASKKMLVKFGNQPETRINIEKIVQRYHCPNPKNRPAESFYTAFSERSVRSGVLEIFKMIIIPCDPDEQPEQVAEGISWDIDKSGESITKVNLNGQVIEIHLNKDQWQVIRLNAD